MCNKLCFLRCRVMFACSVCKFRSFYKEDMAIHLQSRFHKDHFKFLSSQLSKPTTDFLQVPIRTHLSIFHLSMKFIFKEILFDVIVFIS